MDSDSPSINLVIPCAGAGERAGKGMPKQYATIASKPMIVHTLNALVQVSCIQGICIVVSPGDLFIQAILVENGLSDNLKIKVIHKGGATRAQSVLAGLNYFKDQGALDESWILVHDAARCLIMPKSVEQLIQTCLSDPVGGLLACPVADTLKESHGGRVEGTIKRQGKWLAQTPQMFRLGMLMKAFDKAEEHNFDSFTDEASAIEALGHSPVLVEGVSSNFKITYPSDFELAQALIDHRTAKA